MNRQECIRIALVHLIFAVVFQFLTSSSYLRKSATWDEPQHLTAGYTALKLRDYRIDPEHPPFLRMWATLPLLTMPKVKLNTSIGVWDDGNQWEFSHQFLYFQNNADRILNAGRFMIMTLGVLLGVLLFCWARELFGFWPAVITLALYTIEPNILAHAGLVTTDSGVTCFIFGTLYFLWRTVRRVSMGNLAGLTLFFALAHVSKYSALLLGPIVLVLLTIVTLRWRPWPSALGKTTEIIARARKALLAVAVMTLLAVTSYVAMWAVYGFRYTPTREPFEKIHFQTLPLARERVPHLSAIMTWIDNHRLLPNACAQGFLLGQSKASMRSSFLAGRYSLEGWWYYFPIAFVIKTPIGLQMLCLAGIILCAMKWRSLLDNELFVLLPIAAFIGAAMATKLNIGLRHILPIYPLLLLLAGKTIKEMAGRVNKVWVFVLPAFCLIEFALVYPDYLTFFNSAVGGPSNGHKYLVDSNLDWGQDLKELKLWMNRNGVKHINLSYFGTADPAYYGLSCTHLPGAPFFVEDRIQSPKLPGYVAVSATNLRGAYLDETGRAFFKPLLALDPVAVIGNSIFVYYISDRANATPPQPSPHP